LLLTLATGAIVVVGLILFIVPGVYLASRLLYGPYYLIIEGKTVIQAMDLSWSSTKEKSMDYMTILFFYWTTLIIVTFLVLTTISAFVISSGEGSLPFLINVIANTFLSYLQLVLISYPIFYVYKNMDSNF
jgi:membrane-anchored glycerophosphoryl diester phosphodiesterase (GDPDase)